MRWREKAEGSNDRNCWVDRVWAEQVAKSFQALKSHCRKEQSEEEEATEVDRVTSWHFESLCREHTGEYPDEISGNNIPCSVHPNPQHLQSITSTRSLILKFIKCETPRQVSAQTSTLVKF